MEKNKKTVKVADLQNKVNDMAPFELLVSDYFYEKFETYVRDSGMALYRVKAIGELHLNVYHCSGNVERCNRLAVLTDLCGSQSYFVYLCDHDALNPPEVGQIVDARLHFIHIDMDEPEREYYWADSITPINENVKINFVDQLF